MKPSKAAMRIAQTVLSTAMRNATIMDLAEMIDKEIAPLLEVAGHAYWTANRSEIVTDFAPEEA